MFKIIILVFFLSYSFSQKLSKHTSKLKEHHTSTDQNKKVRDYSVGISQEEFITKFDKKSLLHRSNQLKLVNTILEYHNILIDSGDLVHKLKNKSSFKEISKSIHNWLYKDVIIKSELKPINKYKLVRETSANRPLILINDSITSVVLNLTYHINKFKSPEIDQLELLHLSNLEKKIFTWRELNKQYNAIININVRF